MSCERWLTELPVSSLGTDGYFWNAEHWAQSEGMHSWVASNCIMRCYVLVFQMSTAFYLWSHTTGFHLTKQLNTTANSSLRTRLLGILPPNNFFLFLPDKTHLVYLINSAMSVPAFKNGLAVWVELIERKIWSKGSLVKCWGARI